MIPQQSVSQWQQNSVQGAIPSVSPLTPADEAYLTSTLVECRQRLQMALQTAQTYSRLPDLATALGDALISSLKIEAAKAREALEPKLLQLSESFRKEVEDVA